MKFPIFLKLQESWEKIDENPFLQLIFWVLWFGFFVSFYTWSYKDYGTAGNVCWPYFQDCHLIQFIPSRRDSYAYIGVIILLAFIMITSAWSALRKDWVKAMASITVLFFTKLFTFTLLTYSIPANFEYFHLGLLVAFLFLRPKVFALKLTMVVLLFLSATMKFHDSWILGTYFSSLKLGLPFIPDLLIPVATNAVIFLEIVCPWLLLSKNSRLKWISICSLTIFFIYSISLVGMHYQAFTLLPFLAIFLFDDLGNETNSSSSERSVIIGFISLLFLLHLPKHLITEDSRYSLQTYKLGVWMFDSNHQCVSDAKYFYRDGTTSNHRTVSSRAMNRCGPYFWWYGMRRSCEDNEQVKQISWTFDHSINGGPFYRIISLDDICETEYSLFGTNDWLNSKPEASSVVGYPKKNYPYENSDSHPHIVFDSPSIELSIFQAWLKPYSHIISWAWVILWWIFALAYLPKILWGLIRSRIPYKAQ